MKKNLILAICIPLLNSTPVSALEWISMSTDWKYFKGTQEPADSVSAWREFNFNDLAWETGPAPFRFSDGEGGTLLDDMRNGYTTLYLRKKFTIEDPSAFDTLKLNIDFDDGFTVWINGDQAFTENAPASPVYSSTATRSRESGTVKTYRLNKPFDFLSPGENIIAVQGFNRSISNVDFYLDLSLQGCVYLPPVDELQFSATRGYYTDPFDLQITASPAGAQIRYTLDGSRPSPTHGTQYISPIPIQTTTMIRAIGYGDSLAPSEPVTHTYIFPDSVIRQPAEKAGYPKLKISKRNDVDRYVDFKMDPTITQDPAYSSLLTEALYSIPAMSLVLDVDDLFGSNRFYDKGGSGRNSDWQRPASIEYFDPQHPEMSYQAQCAIRSHSHVQLKRSFKLLFKSEYGPAKMRFPLFHAASFHGESAAEDFDKIVLRAGLNRSYTGFMPEDQRKTVYIRDQWARDSQISMSGYGVRGTFVHLFINGLYWGLYNPVERPDEDFAASYFGGDDENWFCANHGGDVTKSPSSADNRWDYFVNTLGTRSMTNTNNFNEMKAYLDLTGFCDYVLLYFYNGGGDWQDRWGHNNFYVVNNYVNPTPIRFIGWDMESSWHDSGPAPQNAPGRSNDRAWIKPQFLTSSEGSQHPYVSNKHKHIARPFRALMRNKEFRVLFADRLYKHCFGNGALSDEQSKQRWRTLAARVEKAVVLESARWGDGRTPDQNTGVDLFTRDEFWYAARDQVDSLMTGNGVLLRDICRNTVMNGYKLYPSIDPPVIETPGGEYQTTLSVRLTNPNTSGTVYYTLDGSDPRLPGGAVSDQALSDTAVIPINQTTVLKTRSKHNATWSALAEAVYVLPGDYSALKMTEVMYHPADEGALEFIELKNTGQPINLTGLQFTEGIAFQFSDGTNLEQNQFCVIVRDSIQFKARYPETKITGMYSKKLDNAGERITLADHFGNTLLSIEYDDTLPWPQEADGQGYSLVPLMFNPTGNQDDAAQWRFSRELGGSPGRDDTVIVRIEERASCKLNFILHQNYPNPFNPETVINFQIPIFSVLTIDVYNILGKKVRTLFHGNRDAGSYQMVWDGKNNQGVKVASGIYICQMKTEKFRSAIRMVLIE